MDERKANMSDDGLVNFAKMSKVLPLSYHLRSFFTNSNLKLLKQDPIVVLMPEIVSDDRLNLCIVSLLFVYFIRALSAKLSLRFCCFFSIKVEGTVFGLRYQERFVKSGSISSFVILWILTKM